jgi:hypothetical protein
MKSLCNIHNFNVAEIMKTVYSFYRVEKQMPTVLHLQVKLAVPIHFNGVIYLLEKFLCNRDLNVRKPKALGQF